MVSFERAWEAWDQLVRIAPDGARYRLPLSWTMGNMGASLLEAGRFEEGLAAHRRALTIREELAREAPENLLRQSDLAWCLLDVTSALRNLGQLDEALRTVERAAAVQERVSAGRPPNTDDRRRLAETLTALGSALRESGRLDEARASLERASSLHQNLVRVHPSTHTYKSDLANGLSQLALIDQARGRPDAARAKFLEAINLLETIDRASPRLYPIQRGQSSNWWAIGELEREAGNDLAAVRALRMAVAVWDRALHEQPDDYRLRLQLGIAHHDLGKLCKGVGRTGDAATAFDRAVTAFDSALHLRRADPDGRSRLLHALWSLAIELRDAGSHDQSRRTLRRAAALEHDLGESGSLNILARAALCRSLSALSVVQFGAGFVAEATESLGRSLAILEVLADLSPAAPSSGASSSAREASSWSAAPASLPFDVDRLSRLHNRILRAPELLTLRSTLTVYEYNLIHVLLDLRQPDEAAAITRLRLRAFPTQGGEWYNSACYIARCVPLVGESSVARRALADEAMDLLGRSVALGFWDYHLAARDPDLDALRQREDFRVLLLDLAFPRRPFAR
jgi:tetratricopeptide (TPR) repeat protein